jgi:hypothetical protein
VTSTIYRATVNGQPVRLGLIGATPVQCARCGEYEQPGHICADMRAALSLIQRAALTKTAPTLRHAGHTYALTWEGCPWCEDKQND